MTREISLTLYAEGTLAEDVRYKRSRILGGIQGVWLGHIRNVRKNSEYASGYETLKTLRDGYNALKKNDDRARRLDLPEPDKTRLFYYDDSDNIIYLNWDDKFTTVKDLGVRVLFIQHYPTKNHSSSPTHHKLRI